MAEGLQKMAVDLVNESIDSFKVWFNTLSSGSASPASEVRSTLSDEQRLQEDFDEDKMIGGSDTPLVTESRTRTPSVKPIRNRRVQNIKYDNSRLSNFYQKSPIQRKLGLDARDMDIDHPIVQDTVIGTIAPNSETLTGAGAESLNSTRTGPTGKQRALNIAAEKKNVHELVTIGSVIKTEDVIKDYYKNGAQNRDVLKHSGTQIQDYNRKDSAISTTTGASYIDGLFDLPTIDESDEDVRTSNFHEIEEFIDNKALRRDKYRATPRPYRKTTHYETKTINEKGISTRVTRIQLPGKSIPRMKLSIQHFGQSKQMRVILNDTANCESLFGNSKKVYAKLCLLPGKRQQKKTKIMSRRIVDHFHDDFYFHIADEEDLESKQLRIKILEKKRFWKKDRPVGEVTIPLKDFDFTFDTTMWCQIMDYRFNCRRQSSCPVFEIRLSKEAC